MSTKLTSPHATQVWSIIWNLTSHFFPALSLIYINSIGCSSYNVLSFIFLSLCVDRKWVKESWSGWGRKRDRGREILWNREGEIEGEHQRDGESELLGGLKASAPIYTSKKGPCCLESHNEWEQTVSGKKETTLIWRKEDIMDMKDIKIFELSENTLIWVSQRVAAFLYFGSIWTGVSMFLMNSNGIRHLWVPWNSNSNKINWEIRG